MKRTSGRPSEARRVGVAPDGYASRVVFHAPRERVFDAVATAAGVRGWWTPLVSGSGAARGQLCLDFEGLDEHIVLRVEKAARPSSVRWLCVAHTGLPEWNGTKITFELAEPAPHESELNFRHIGLTPAQECYDHYRVGWDHFLNSLAAYVERGRGTPFAG